METKTPNYIDWIDEEGYQHAYDEQRDRWRRFRDSNQPDEPKTARQCQGCALSVRVFGVDVDVLDMKALHDLAERECDNCCEMQWNGRPLTNFEMHLVGKVSRERSAIHAWWDGFIQFLGGLECQTN